MTRANPVGWFIGAFFLLGGIAFWVAMPGIGIGQIWVAVAVFLLLLFWFMGRRAAKAESLRQTGLPGTATILDMTQTGVYINENPQVKLHVRIDATGIPPYEVEKRVTVPLIALGVLGSGRPLSVFVDPNDHENIYFDWSGGGGAVSAATGPFTFQFHDGTSVDITNDAGAKQEVVDALRANGLDPQSGMLDLRSNPKARAAVLDAIRRHGYHVPEDAPAGGGAGGAPGAADDDRPGVERLMELQQARDKGLISEAEFQETKDRILKSM